jgi:MFS family permease
MMARPLKYYMPVYGLGLTQIMGYGTLLYSYAVLLPIMADELGLGLSDVFGLLSIGFFFGGLSAILAGFAVDRIGGRWVMSLGSVASAGGLWGLSQVTGPIGLTVAILLTQMAAMFVLYDVAFASIAKLRPGPAAQSAISGITLFGGVASTIYWPLTLALSNLYGWQVTWQIHAASVVLICVPAHWFSLRTENGTCAPQRSAKKGQRLGRHYKARPAVRQ